VVIVVTLPISAVFTRVVDAVNGGDGVTIPVLLVVVMRLHIDLVDCC